MTNLGHTEVFILLQLFLSGKDRYEILVEIWGKTNWNFPSSIWESAAQSFLARYNVSIGLDRSVWQVLVELSSMIFFNIFFWGLWTVKKPCDNEFHILTVIYTSKYHFLFQLCCHRFRSPFFFFFNFKKVVNFWDKFVINIFIQTSFFNAIWFKNA